MGNGNFRPPQNRHPSTDNQKNLSQLIKSATPYGCAKLGAYLSTGASEHMGEILLMPFLGNSPTGQTRRRIFTHDGSNDADSRKLCTVIETTKCPSWVVPTHALQIQDGGSRHLWKIAISRPRFDRFWRNLVSWCSSTLLTVLTVKNRKFRKSKMLVPPSWKIKIAISQPRFERFWRNLAWWRISTPLERPGR